MDEHCCLYALTWADCPTNIFGPGVDSRFAVELVRCGRVAALTSRVGLDQFDMAKLQEGTADFPWLSKVAVRHHEIIAAAARHAPVLPMRLGIFFASRSSLIAKLIPYAAKATEFLRYVEDRQEWAVKIYIDEDRAEKAIPGNPPHVRPTMGTWCPSLTSIDEARPGGGTQYLLAKGLRGERRRQVQTTVGQAVLTAEARLQGMTDSWQRLRPLPTTLTNRLEKMVWNGAFLLSKSILPSFQAACEQLGNELAPGGLIVELTGPWPAYHFCPSFEPQHEDSSCRCTC